MMWWNHGGWGVGDWLAMSLLMVAFWGLVVALVVWLVHSFRDEPTDTSNDHHTSTERADEVLADRFARGEIDADEFTHRRELLHAARGGGSSPGGASR